MKKSEMIEHIAEALLALHGGAPDEWEEVREVTKMRRLKAAHTALKTAEEKGILPPEHTFKDPGHFPGDQFEYVMRVWEDEDEKK